jgi:hypothetical protein
MASRHGRPNTADPALGADFVRWTSEELQEGKPRVFVGAWVNGDLADQMVVEEACEGRYGLVVSSRLSTANANVVG